MTELQPRAAPLQSEINSGTAIGHFRQYLLCERFEKRGVECVVHRVSRSRAPPASMSADLGVQGPDP